MEEAAAVVTPTPAPAAAQLSLDVAATATVEHAAITAEPLGRGLLPASTAGVEPPDPAKLLAEAGAEFNRGMVAAGAEGRALALQHPAESWQAGPAQHSDDPARIIMAAVEESRRSLPRETQEPTRPAQEAQEPADIIRAALEAAKPERGSASDARQALLRAGASTGELAAGTLQHLPSPGRVQDLAESPEKSAVAAAKTVASVALPKAAPVVGTVANQIEKQIDHSSEPERTR